MSRARYQRGCLVLGLIAASLAAGACANHDGHEALPFYTDATFTPHFVANDTAAMAQIPSVGAFSLLDQLGRRITERDVAGRVRVVNFFYTECGDVCPRTREKLRAIAKTYATDDRVVILSHTVTPHADSVPQLAHFAGLHDINPRRWHLLGGDEATLRRLATTGYHLVPPSGKSWGVDTLAHTERVVLVDQAGRVRGVYNGLLALEMENLQSDLQRLLAVGG